MCVCIMRVLNVRASVLCSRVKVRVCACVKKQFVMCGCVCVFDAGCVYLCVVFICVCPSVTAIT